jgi:hypothetical protein
LRKPQSGKQSKNVSTQNPPGTGIGGVGKYRNVGE